MQLKPEEVLNTVKSCLPNYFGKATLINVRPSVSLKDGQKVVKEDELAVDVGYAYVAVRQEGDFLIHTANMTWDAEFHEYGSIPDIPQRMPIVH